MEPLSSYMPRLRAETWSLDHAEVMHEMYSDGAVTRMLHFEPNTDIEQTRSYIADRVERFRALPAGMGAWPLYARDSDAFVGVVLLKPLPDGKIEVGWHLKRAMWGCGYATEAGRAAIQYGFEVLELDEIYAITLPENLRSQEVCRRCGMTRLARTTDYHDLELDLFRIRATDS
ncbi:MAG: GNAT family N-acetyltransferase [Phycisphaerae bacterium]